MRPSDLETAWKIILGGVRSHAYPGAVVLVRHRGRRVLFRSCGHAALFPEPDPMRKNTIFDLASLTKVVATATSIMILIDDGKLSLDSSASSILPGFFSGEKKNVKIKHLLSHSSGLPDWKDLYSGNVGSDEVIDEICEKTELECAPGSHYLYSDLGYILLGRIVENISGMPLDKFAETRIFKPLKMKHTFFVRLSERKAGNPSQVNFASTEFSNFRFEFVRGVVHDENAYAMDGVSGHAGLFSTAEDLSIFSQTMLRRGKIPSERSKNLVSESAIESMVQFQGEYFGLGWWLKTRRTPKVGNLSPGSFGHSGFTGTSMWMDPKLDASIIVLTNRVHPVRDGEASLGDKSVGIMMKRQSSWASILTDFHDAVAPALRS